MMKRTFVMLLASTLAVGAAAYAQEPAERSQDRPAAPAQPAPAPAQASQSASGELVSVDAKANTLTIKAAAGEMTFQYNDQTRVTGAQKGVAGLATMKGSQVTVQFRKEGQANIATSIEVRAEQAK